MQEFQHLDAADGKECLRLQYLLSQTGSGSNAFHFLDASEHLLVPKLVRAGVDLNKVNDHGLSPLHAHCFKGNLEVVRGLLFAGANLSQRDGHQWWLPFHTAVSARQAAVVQLLVEEFGQDPNQRYPDRGLATQVAAFSGDLPTLRALLQNGGAVPAVMVQCMLVLRPPLGRWLQLTEGWSQLHFACEGRRCEMVARLLRSEDSPSFLGPAGKSGWTPLDCAQGYQGDTKLPLALEPSAALIRMIKHRTEPYDPRFHHLFPAKFRQGALQVLSIPDQITIEDSRAIAAVNWELWLYVMSFAAPHWFREETMTQV